MGMTLNLIDILLTTGRHLAQAGRSTEAIHALNKLAAFRKLPRKVREEIHTLLGDIHLGLHQYKDARRHLAAAIAANFNNAETCFKMALAIEEDGEADFDRAETYYARAVELEPKDAFYWADYGSYLFTLGKAKAGLKATRKAHALGRNEAELVGHVAAVLRREEHYEEAAAILRAALFENHGDARFRQLWQEHQHHMIYVEQERKRQTAPAKPGKPVILPFKPASRDQKYMNLGGKTIRIDQAQPLKEPQDKQPQQYKRPPKG